MAEKTNGEEIYGGAEGALERAEKSIENRRAFVKKAMEPAEKAKKELVKATATDEVRKQGIKDNRVPKIRPYVEKVDVSDRKVLSRLISEAKKEKRPWRVTKSIKEGYRYTFYTKRLLEGKAEFALDAAADMTVGNPAGEESAQAPEAVEAPTAWDVLNGLLNLAITDKNELSVCIKAADDDAEPTCLLTRPLSDEEISILGVAKAEPEEPKEPADDAKADAADAKTEEPLDEASSAEKRAYRNGGKDLDDLTYGRTMGRIRNQFMRDGTVAMYKNGGDEQAAVKDVYRIPAEKAAADFEKKERKMMAKGYTPDPEVDELSDPGKHISRKCPKCGKVDLNDAGECPLCDLGDASVLEDSLRIEKADATGKIVESNSDKSETAIDSDVEIRLDDLMNFKPFAGARDTYDIIVGEGKLPELAEILADFAHDGKMTTSDLNDMLWFERDWVLNRLDIDLARIKSGIKSGDDVIDAEE